MQGDLAAITRKPDEKICVACHSEKSPRFKFFLYSALAPLVHKTVKQAGRSACWLQTRVRFAFALPVESDAFRRNTDRRGLVPPDVLTMFRCGLPEFRQAARRFAATVRPERHRAPPLLDRHVAMSAVSEVRRPKPFLFSEFCKGCGRCRSCLEPKRNLPVSRWLCRIRLGLCREAAHRHRSP